MAGSERQGDASPAGAAPARRGVALGLAIAAGAGLLCLAPWAGLRRLHRLWDEGRVAVFEGLAADGLASRPADVAVVGDPERQQALLDAAAPIGLLPGAVEAMLGARREQLRRAREGPEAAAALGVFEPDPADPSCPPDLQGAMALILAEAARAEPEVDDLLAQSWRLPCDTTQGLELDLPALVPAKHLVRLFTTRAGWRSLEGDVAGAWADVLRALRLTERVDQPAVIARLVRVACAGVALDAAGELLAAHGRPAAAQRPALDAALAALDEGAGLTCAYQGELAFFEGGLVGPAELRGLVGDDLGALETLRARLEWPRWRFDVTLRQSEFVRVLHEAEATPLDAVRQLANLEQDLKDRGLPLAQLLFTSASGVLAKDLRLRARVRLTLAALRLDDPKGPGSPPALADPYDPQRGPLRRLDDPDGRARLWSVGPDNLDQGGLVAPEGTPVGAPGHDLVVEVAPGG